MLLAALLACTASVQNPLTAGSPTKLYNHFCQKGDVAVDGDPDIAMLNSWLDIGSDNFGQVFDGLIAIDGSYNPSIRLPNHRVVAYDMRLASLLNVDATNSAFKVLSCSAHSMSMTQAI